MILIFPVGYSCSVQIPCTFAKYSPFPKSLVFVPCLFIPMDNRDERGYRGTENKLRVWNNGGRDFMLKAT